MNSRKLVFFSSQFKHIKSQANLLLTNYCKDMPRGVPNLLHFHDPIGIGLNDVLNGVLKAKDGRMRRCRLAAAVAVWVETFQ